MNNYKQVEAMVEEWKGAGLSKAEIVIKCAEACLGWDYVFGAYGNYCTESNRRSFADRGTCPAGEAAEIRRKCQAISGGEKCDSCKFYPEGRTRVFDCRGFTRWVLQQVGINIEGSGCTTQWNDERNWASKGELKDLPEEQVCCLFLYNSKTGKMEHTGFYVGGGMCIHCSGEVKIEELSKVKWTHWAVPKGLEGGDTPMPMPEWKPTLRKGSRGEYVTLLQTKLLQLGYSLAPYGADGSFGNKTAEALKAFQSDSGLIADGVCGPMTWEVMDNATPGKKYTATIRGLAKSKAVELLKQFPEAEITEEDS